MKRLFLPQFILNICALSALVGLSTACNETADVDIESIPERPIVITAPMSIDTDGDGEADRTLNPPWFRLNMKVNNHSAKTVTIVTYRIIIKIMDETGALVTTTSEINLNDIEFLNPDVAPGTSSTSVSLFVDGLTKGKSFVYSLKIEAQGWTGTRTAPEERLENLFFFTFTQ